jgi:hypothetical protein
MRFGPFGSGLRPGELPAFFAFDPFVYADLLLNEVGNPIEGVGVHHRRHRDVMFGLENLAHAGSVDVACGERKQRFRDNVLVQLLARFFPSDSPKNAEEYFLLFEVFCVSGTGSSLQRHGANRVTYSASLFSTRQFSDVSLWIRSA